MTVATKCRAKNPATCDDPNCPEKRAGLQAFIGSMVPVDTTTRVKIAAAPIMPHANLALVQSETQAFLHEYGSHEFANHGNEHAYGEFITLDQMADGDKARNNCYIASSEVLELLGNEAFGGENLMTIAVANEDMYHAALAVMVEDDWYAIDFTARQFDENLPFPYVAKQEEWKRTIDEANDLYTAYCADASDPSSFEDDDASADDDTWD